jgi:coenzyme PQQ synthesis protein D (PqqD)
MSLGPKSRIVRRETVPQARLSDDNIVLLNAERGNYYSLDHTGLRIWELLAVETTVTELCERLSYEYDVVTGDCLADTMSFCQRLRDENLIICLDEKTA